MLGKSGEGGAADKQAGEVSVEAAEQGQKARSKREIFVLEYLKDLNGTRAAIAAGAKARSAHVTASRWLKEPAIKKQVKAELKRRKEELRIEKDRILDELSYLAYSNLADFEQFLKDGADIKKLANGKQLDSLFAMPRYMLAAVREISFDRNGRPKLKLHPKTPAAELLGKHRKLFSDRLEVEGNLTLVVDM